MAYGFYGAKSALVHNLIKNYHEPPTNKWHRLRQLGRVKLSLTAQLRLEWIIFYHTAGKRNVTATANHFGVSRKTIHKYVSRFSDINLSSLEELSRSPKQKRHPTITRVEEKRVIEIRKASKCKWSKTKVARRYRALYGETISPHKVQLTINKYHLYPDKQAIVALRIQRKRHRSNPKPRIHQFEKQNHLGFLWHTDSIIINWYGKRKTIITANEEQTKLAYARVYSSSSSRSATDFLKRLLYLSNNQLLHIHHDNGSEFAGEFQKACRKLNIPQIYSRVRRPKDNPSLERFNGVLQDEWLSVSEAGLFDDDQANQDLTDWLVMYNADRPHETLELETPLDYATAHYPLSPMWASGTIK